MLMRNFFMLIMLTCIATAVNGQINYDDGLAKQIFGSVNVPGLDEFRDNLEKGFATIRNSNRRYESMADVSYVLGVPTPVYDDIIICALSTNDDVVMMVSEALKKATSASSFRQEISLIAGNRKLSHFQQLFLIYTDYTVQFINKVPTIYNKPGGEAVHNNPYFWVWNWKCVTSVAAGVLGGGLEGAAAGTAVPVVGTTAGGIIGGIAGGLAGYAAGCADG